MGTFAEYLQSSGIKEHQILRVSKKLEQFTREDYNRRAARMKARADAKKYGEVNALKPEHSGRAVTEKSLKLALADEPIARKSRSKILKAVNELLKSKGKEPVNTRTLFGLAPVKKGRKIEKKQGA
ncbi:MAG: hypothetical protein GMKNLPBB_03172 [Myxococcota bacterium]|nr:hypothetical protein [Myxococcota bacterium]